MTTASFPLQNISRMIGGIGIICGLEFSVRPNSSLDLSEGYGVTSSGILLHHPGGNFKYYRTFPDPRSIRWRTGGLNLKRQIETWELLTEKAEGSRPLTPQAIDARPFFEGKIGILYLEKRHPPSIIVLLIDQDDLWEILSQQMSLDPNCSDNALVEPDDIYLYALGSQEKLNGQQLFFRYNRNIKLRPIALMRFGFAAEDQAVCDPADQNFAVSGNTFEAISSEYHTIILDALDQLENKVKDVLHSSYFSSLFPEQQREYLEKYIDYLVNKRWIEIRDEADKKLYIQYFFDFVRDLVNTYNEIIFEMGRLMADCNPDPELFPFYLLLGEIQEDVVHGPSVFRHEFRQPPIYQDNARRLKKIRFLHWRLTMMIKCFYLPDVEPIDLVDNHYTQVDDFDFGKSEEEAEADLVIRFTPTSRPASSVDPDFIPFYYYTASDYNAILGTWSYEATSQGRLQYLQSYYSREEDLETYTNICSVKRPFSYAFDNLPFYRIEGHIGKQYENKSALETEIEEIRKKFNLDFDLVLAVVDGDIPNIDDLFIQDVDQFNLNEIFSGAEHLGGVSKDGTLLLVLRPITDGTGGIEIIGDFSLSYGPSSSGTRYYQPAMIKKMATGQESRKEEKGASKPAIPVKSEKETAKGLSPAAQKLQEKKGLQAIQGIGKHISDYLRSKQIIDYKKLAELSITDLKAILEEKPRYKSMDTTNWLKQAQLASKGDWEKLLVLQKKLMEKGK